MSLETSLYAALAAVTPRVFPDVAPVNTPRPYVTYQQIGGSVVNFAENTMPGVRNAHVQVNVWSDTRIEAMALIASIETAIRAAAAFTGSPIGAPVGDFEPDVNAYGARQDFECWASA